MSALLITAVDGFSPAGHRRPILYHTALTALALSLKENEDISALLNLLLK